MTRFWLMQRFAINNGSATFSVREFAGTTMLSHHVAMRILFISILLFDENVYSHLKYIYIVHVQILGQMEK